MLFILSGSSGAGKNTIINKLIEENEDFQIMKSCTTRTPRGVNDLNAYFFLTEEDFQRKIKNNEFFENEEVHKGLFYGVLKASLEKIKNSRVYLKDIDVLGAMNILRGVGKENVKLIYIDVPKQELKKRILERGENEQNATLRLSRYDFEKSFIDKYDLVIKNESLEESMIIIKDYIDMIIKQKNTSK